MMPDQDRITRAVTDMESGEFTQATGRLRRESGYCCLGIMCERYRRDTGSGEWNGNQLHEYDFTAGGEDDVGVMPLAVAEWYGLSCNPMLTPRVNAAGVSIATAAGWNDQGVPLTEIAAAFRALYLSGT